MANSKSAKKRVLVAERNRVRNQAVKTRVKTMAKKVLATLEVKDVEAAKAALSVAYKELERKSRFLPLHKWRLEKTFV